MWAFRHQIPCKPRHPSGGRFAEDSANQGCTRRAAEAMFVAQPLVSGQVFRSLVAVVGKSMVVALREGSQTRFRLLETIRGIQRGAASRDRRDRGDGHAEYFCQLALDLSRELFGPHQIVEGRRLADENDSLLATLNHAIDTDNVAVTNQAAPRADLGDRAPPTRRGRLRGAYSALPSAGDFAGLRSAYGVGRGAAMTPAAWRTC